MGTFMKKIFANLAASVVLSLFAISCGQNSSNVLTGVTVGTTTVNNDVMVSVAANINLGAMSLPAVSLPIPDPHGQGPIGSVELVPGLNGVNTVKVTVDITALTNVQPALATLPNGNSIPLIASNGTVAISLGGGAKIYLTLSQTVTAIGVAIPISSFDSLGATLPGVNFFPVVSINNVVATAGLFTGAKAGQNGIAIVADVSKIVNLGNILPSSSSMAMMAEESQVETVKLNYASQTPNKNAQNVINQALYSMNAKKLKLKLAK
jgi:hypothetical protein